MGRKEAMVVSVFVILIVFAAAASAFWPIDWIKGLFKKPSIALSPESVTQCMNLNTSDTVYILSSNISANITPCFTITADNVLLDGASFSVNGTGEGIVAQAVKNVTIVNLGLHSFSRAIILNYTNSSSIYNSRIENSANAVTISGGVANSVFSNVLINNTISAILVSDSSGTSIYSNTISNNHLSGLLIRRSSGNLVDRNTFTNNTAPAGSTLPAYAIKVEESTSSNIKDNLFVSNSHGIILSNTTSSTLRNLTILGTNQSAVELAQQSNSNTVVGVNVSGSRHGLRIVQSSDNNIQNALFADSYEAAVYLTALNGTFIPVRNNALSNVTFGGNVQDLYLWQGDIANTLLSNTLVGPFFNSNRSNTFDVHNPQHGIVRSMALQINGGANFSEIVQIGNRSLSFTELVPVINTSTEVIFYNIHSNITNITVLLNGTLCSPPLCSINTAPAQNQISFNVTIPGNYTVNYSIIIPPPQVFFLVQLYKNGNGSGSVDSVPSGLSCSTACNATFLNGTRLNLTAEPSTSSSKFAHWTGVCSSFNTTCIINVTSNQTINVTFIRVATTTVNNNQTNQNNQQNNQNNANNPPAQNNPPVQQPPSSIPPSNNAPQQTVNTTVNRQQTESASNNSTLTTAKTVFYLLLGVLVIALAIIGAVLAREMHHSDPDRIFVKKPQPPMQPQPSKQQPSFKKK